MKKHKEKNNNSEILSEVSQYSNILKEALKGVMGYSSKPISIKGTPSQVKAFTNALKGEKSFLESYRDYGPSHPETESAKLMVEECAEKFEKELGLEWPFI